MHTDFFRLTRYLSEIGSDQGEKNQINDLFYVLDRFDPLLSTASHRTMHSLLRSGRILANSEVTTLKIEAFNSDLLIKAQTSHPHLASAPFSRTSIPFHMICTPMHNTTNAITRNTP